MITMVALSRVRIYCLLLGQHAAVPQDLFNWRLHSDRELLGLWKRTEIVPNHVTNGRSTPKPVKSCILGISDKCPIGSHWSFDKSVKHEQTNVSTD